MSYETHPTRNLKHHTLHFSLRHRIRICPILDLVKVPAHVLRVVFGPVALFAGFGVESKDIDIREAHEVHAKNFNAVIEMRADSLGLVICVAPFDLGIVLGNSGHAEQIQAVQLVEDFEANAVSCFARLGVGDLHGVVRHVELGEVLFGDHLIGEVGYVHPRILGRIADADVHGCVQGARKLEYGLRVFDHVHGRSWSVY